MTMTPAARAVLAGLAPQDAAALAPCLTAAVRRDLRDAYVRVALARCYSTQSRNRAARALSKDLSGAIVHGTRLADFVTAIRILNGGKDLGWRQITNIADGLSRGTPSISLQEIRLELQRT